MKKIKKDLCLVVAILFIIGAVITGCGNKSEPGITQKTASSTTSETTSAESEKSIPDPYKIDWYFIGNGPQPDQVMIEDEMNKHLDADYKDLNVTVKLHPYDWGSYEDKMRALLASGEKIDLFFSASWGSVIYENLRKGVVLDLTDLIDKNAPHAKEVLKGGFLEGSAIDGKNYAIPCNKEKASQKGFLFNKKMVDEFGFDISKVQTLEDLEPMLKAVKEKYPNDYPLEANQYQSPSSHYVKSYDAFAGKQVFMTYGTENIVPVYEDPNVLATYKKTREFFKAGYIRKDAATIKDMAPDRKSGKLFVMSEGLKPGKDVEVSNATGVHYVQVGIGKPLIKTGDVSGSMMAISKACKQPERVLQFYDLFYTDKKLLDTLNYGIENKHYVRISENVVDYAPDTDKGKKSGYNPGTPWMFGNQFASSIWANEDPEKWVKFKQFNDSAEASPALGFVFDEVPVKNEIAACNSVMKEFVPGLESGSMDPDVYVPRFKEKLLKAGIEKVVNEVRKQYADWKAKK